MLRPLLAALLLALGAALVARARAPGRGGNLRLGLRLAFLGALALLLGGASWGGAAPRRRAIAVDVSRSVGDVGLGLARAALADLDPGDRVAWVVFGTGARGADPGPPDVAPAALERLLAAPPDPRGTDLGAALEAAARAAGPGGEVVLVSDGRDTAGRALEAATALAAAGVVVHALPVAAAPRPGARLARLTAPARVAAGAVFAVEVEVGAARATEVALRLEALAEPGEASPGGARPLGRVDRAVGPDDPLVARFEVEAPQGGLLRLRARVEAAGVDDHPEDDALEALVAVGDARRAVVLEGDGEGGPVGDALARAGLSVERRPARGGGAAPPWTPGEVDLVALVDVPAAAAPLPALRAALARGAALVVAGCDRAWGAGGYAESALEALLPVTSGPGEERTRPLDLVVALDASGSMNAPAGADAAGAGGAGPGTRFRAAVRAALDPAHLRPGDRLAVVRFAAAPTVVRALAPLGPGELADLAERLAAHPPAGDTDAGLGLVRALELLAPATGGPGGSPGAPSRPPLRVVVLVSDGEDPAPARHVAALAAAARAVAPTGGGGPGDDPPPSVLLVRVGGAGPAASFEALGAALAPHAAARAVVVADAGAALRALLEAELAQRRDLVRPGPLAVTPTAAGAARGLPALTAPRYAPVAARPEAVALARADDAALDRPPTAVLGPGGRVLALPLPPTEAAAALGPLLAGLLPPAREDAALEVTRRGPWLELTVTGRDLPPRLVATVVAGDAGAPGAPGGTRAPGDGADRGARLDAELLAETPERAAGRVRAPGAGGALVVVTTPGGPPLCAATAPPDARDEVAWPGPDLGLLAEVARRTGGTVLPAPPDRARPLPRRGPGPGERPGALALLALALLVAEAAVGAVGAAGAPRAA